MACSIVALLLLPTLALAEFGSRPATDSPYLTNSTSSGQVTNAGRCGKFHNTHGPKGYRTRWRAMNTDDSTLFWQTPTGPRRNYATNVEDVDEDLWNYLAGDVQLFLSYTSEEGFRMSVFGALRCTAFSRGGLFDPNEEDPHSGVYMHIQDGEPLVLASQLKIDGIENPMPFTPIVLGMSPGVPGDIIEPKEWESRGFDDFPEVWFRTTFKAETQVPSDLKMWTRETSPRLEVRDGSDITMAEWTTVRNTRLYDEEQCLAFIDFEQDLYSRSDVPPLIAVSGIFDGGNVCDIQNATWKFLHETMTGRRLSANKIQFPLSDAEGILLVVIPALWELITALVILFVRITRGHSRQVTIQQKIAWIGVEFITIMVVVGEFGLLLSGTLDQLKWQPCWIGRWSQGKELLMDSTNLTLAISPNPSDDFISSMTDAQAIECIEDPGTDAKWAISIGVVIVVHLGLLLFECVYFSVEKVRTVVDKSVSVGVGSLRSRGLLPRDDENEENDESLPTDDEHELEVANESDGATKPLRREDTMPF